MRRLAVLVGIAGCGMAQPATACQWPANWFEDETRDALVVTGDFSLETIEERKLTILQVDSLPGQRLTFDPLLTIYTGELVAEDGATYPLEFERHLGDRTCSPFTLPEEDTDGTFYIEANEDGSFKLIHWEGAD